MMKLIKSSIISKDIFRLSNAKYLVTQLYYSNQQLCDLIETSENKNNGTTAISELKIDYDVDCLIRNNIIDCNYAIKILKSMQKLYTANKIPLSDIIKNEDFINISEILNQHIQKIDLNEAIHLLNVLHSTGVPSSSIIIQSILQLIRCYINDLNLNQIYFLTSVLSYMNETHLNNAILTGVVEVFKAQVKFQVDVENDRDLIQAFIYASKYLSDKNVLKYLAKELNKTNIPIDLNSAIVILLRLFQLDDEYDFKKPLLKKVIGTVTDKLHDLNNITIMNIITNMYLCLKRQQKLIYYPDLIDRIVSESIVRNFGLHEWIKLLSILNKIRHVNIELLEHMSYYLYEYPSVLIKFYPHSIFIILSGLASANYKPKVWDKIVKYFVNNEVEDNILYYAAIDLASFQYYDSVMLQKIFNNVKPTNIFLQESNKLIHRIYYMVKILHPTYLGPWPPDTLINSINDMIHKENELFHSNKSNTSVFLALKAILKDSYIGINIKIDCIPEPIDYIIPLKNNSPLNLNSIETSDNNIENFEIALNTERLAILFLKRSNYSRNKYTIKPYDLIKIQMLKKMSYKVIYIFENTWNSMNQHKRIIYLKNNMNLNNILIK